MNNRKTRRGRGAQTPDTDSETGHKPDGGTFALAAECTVADAGSLKAGLAKLLEEPETVAIDISAVQRVDTAGLQVLTTFVLDRMVQDRDVEWVGHAPALTAAATLLGLNPILKLPTAEETAGTAP
jgi:phospholipid transport system transporter-binding protein